MKNSIIFGENYFVDYFHFFEDCITGSLINFIPRHDWLLTKFKPSNYLVRVSRGSPLPTELILSRQIYLSAYGEFTNLVHCTITEFFSGNGEQVVV